MNREELKDKYGDEICKLCCREYFAKPIADMKMTYSNSAMTIEEKVVNPEVSKCFQALMDALNKQLDSYRK